MIGAIIGLSVVIIIGALFIYFGLKDEDDLAGVGFFMVLFGIIILSIYIYKMNVKEYYKKAEVVKIERIQDHLLIVVKDQDPFLKKELKWDNKDNIYIKVEVENNGDVIETIVNKGDIYKDEFVDIKGDTLDTNK